MTKMKKMARRQGGQWCLCAFRGDEPLRVGFELTSF